MGAQKEKPNIILLMCDDLGYGDTGFNGNTVIRTPHLDQLCREGARFTRFHAGGPVCSPTRGTCLTGRHYSRYGITHANRGSLPVGEITLAHACREKGYRTGHFGKWHLGTLSRNEKDGNRGGAVRSHLYAPPWERGFDVCFSTEAKVPTWDPMITPDEPRGTRQTWGVPGSPFGSAYWNEKGERITENMEGDDSRVIVDRADPFIRECTANEDPFLAVIWFHAPHTPVVAGPECRGMYSDYSEDEQHYYGCVTALDEQVGRLNALVKALGIEGNTILFFCSDNGPEGGVELSKNGRSRGVTAGLRGRKRGLFEGGVAVPALAKWPSVTTAGGTVDVPCSTLDYFPSLIRTLDFSMPDSRPLDGIDMRPLLEGSATARERAIPYRFLERKSGMFGSPTLALTGNRFKFLTNLHPENEHEMLFDLDCDPGETINIIADLPEMAERMRNELNTFIKSCRESHFGGDYPVDHPEPFQEVTGGWADRD